MLSRLVSASSSAVTRRSSALLAQRAFLSTSASQSHLIVNAVGKDRLGIVSDISKHVTDIGGNVGESQAARLGKHFSIMMLVNVPTEEKAALEGKLKALDGLQTTVFETQVDQAEFSPTVAYSGSFELEGADNPGIVHKLTSFFTRHGLSVDKMETSDEIAPHGGTTLFHMKGTANALEPLAAGFDINEIKQDLDQLADELNCDIRMHDNIVPASSSQTHRAA